MLSTVYSGIKSSKGTLLLLSLCWKNMSIFTFYYQCIYLWSNTNLTVVRWLKFHLVRFKIKILSSDMDNINKSSVKIYWCLRQLITCHYIIFFLIHFVFLRLKKLMKKHSGNITWGPNLIILFNTLLIIHFVWFDQMKVINYW
jgi:hypothetical protein